VIAGDATKQLVVLIVVRGRYAWSYLWKLPEDRRSTMSEAQTVCKHPLCPSHACCLTGLWWNDAEFGPAVDELWRSYVSKRHEWDQYESDVAKALGLLLQAAQEANNH
jgi:hypothetical protein